MNKLIFFLSLQFLLKSIGFADMATETLYLTWQRDPETTMTLQWLTPPDQTNDEVLFKTSCSVDWIEVKGTHFLLSKSKNYLLHRLELTDLTPQTVYQIKLKDKIFSFHTMPKELNPSLKFIVGGDMYHDATVERMEQTCRQAATSDPDFVVIGGDIAYAVSTLSAKENIERWVSWIRAWNKCMISTKGELIPVIAAIGNHDVPGQYGQSPKQAEVFCNLFPTPENKVYRVLDFGSYMSFFLLDSGHANPIEKEQTKWLKSALKVRQNITHKFAVYHVPAYPSIRKFNNKYSAAIRHNWVPLFENYGIQLAFEHHDHAYKRTFPLLKNRPHIEGVVYLGDGAWSVDEPRCLKSSKRLSYISKFVPSRHFIVVTLTKDQQSILAISDEGKVLDEFSQATSKRVLIPSEKKQEKKTFFQKLIDLFA